MDEIIEPLDITDVRMYLQIPDSDDSRENALFLQFISMARARLEPMLPFYISKQTITLTGDALAGHALVKDGVMRIESAVVLDPKGVARDLKVGPPVGGAIRFPPMAGDYRIRIRTAMTCPPDVKMALLMMVRNLWEDRTSDPLTEEVMQAVWQKTWGGVL